MEAVLIIIIIALVVCYAIFKDVKGTKQNVFSYTLELMNQKENRETIVFRLMTNYKLKLHEANQVYDDVELSGLADKL